MMAQSFPSGSEPMNDTNCHVLAPSVVRTTATLPSLPFDFATVRKGSDRAYH
jgi:hypothetical protein